MLTHRSIKHIDLSHEPGQWIEVRLPSFNILERAREVKSKKAIALMAGVDLSQFRGVPNDAEQAADSAYDRLTLLQECITGWSYEEPLTPGNVAELDETSIIAVIAELLPSAEADSKKG